MALILVSIAWIGGIYIGSKLSLPLYVIFTGLLPLLLIPFLSRHWKSLLLTGLCLLAFLGGSLHFKSDISKLNQQTLQHFNNKGNNQIVGTIVNDPEFKGRTQVFQISAEKIKIEDESINVSGKAIVRVPRYPEYRYGDVLSITGTLKTPQQIDDFDYKEYLARKGIQSIIYYPDIEIIERDKGSKILAAIYSFRVRLSQSLSQSLPEPQCSIAQCILLGIRSNMPDSIYNQFITTGTAHLLAISGLHLSIIIGILLSIGIWIFGKRYYIYIWLALAAIWLYVILTGMRPPVVRGAIMGSVFLMGEYLGRQRSASTALFFAAAVMIGIEPQLLWDASFQLSFSAMAGLVFLFPHFQRWGRRQIMSPSDIEQDRASIATVAIDSLAVTLAAVIATMPLIAFHFGSVSLVSLPSTFFSLPALPGIIITAALTAVTGLFIPFLAQIIGWTAWFFISYLILIIQIFDALPFKHINLDGIRIWQIWLYYALIAGVIITVKQRKQIYDISRNAIGKIRYYVNHACGSVLKIPRKILFFPLLFITLLIWAAVLNMPDHRLHVSVLNVGQGDAILIQTPNGQDILIDGGPDPDSLNQCLGHKMPFWDRSIDLVLLTQPQADHITGLLSVLRNYNVETVIESEVDYDSSIYNQWHELIAETGVKYINVHAGYEFDLGDGIKIQVLHPPENLLQDTSDDIDNNGIVLRLDWKNVSFLFTADIHSDCERYLIAERACLNSTVLKVAHHGSRTSTIDEFLDIVMPAAAVISAGKDNRFGHPHPEVLDRLKNRIGSDNIFITSEDGTIEFITDGDRLWVKKGL